MITINHLLLHWLPAGGGLWIITLIIFGSIVGATDGVAESPALTAVQIAAFSLWIGVSLFVLGTAAIICFLWMVTP